MWSKPVEIWSAYKIVYRPAGARDFGSAGGEAFENFVQNGGVFVAGFRSGGEE